MEVYFSIGSNLGDREANIRSALEMIDRTIGTNYIRLSEIRESEAWGFDGPPFFDCVAVYSLPECGLDSELHAKSLLHRCKEIERTLGRRDKPEINDEGCRIYHSRIIDIDILFYGTKSVDNEELQIPHKMISKREFIKILVKDVASDEILRAFERILYNNL